MRKGTLIVIGVGVAATALLIAPDAWATTQFTKIDDSLNKAATAITGLGGIVGTGGVIEAVTAARFGHGGYMMGGGKTALTGGGIAGSTQISTLVLGSGTSFTGLTMLPVDTVIPWLHSLLAWIS